ncbi:MAG: lysylphosphatidylglycerol synthase transmembrane domain-containing protein [Candidatus Promineifilaceae bacterium]
MKRWIFWLGVLISAIFVWLALRGLRLEAVWASMRAAEYGWLVPSVGVYFLAVWARTWRWHYMLRPLKWVPTGRLFPVVVIGYMGNNVYPLRAGEVLRSFVLRGREGVGMGASLATVVVERVFDGLVMLAFVFAALPLAPLPSGPIRSAVASASLVFFAALVFFIGLAAVPAQALRLAEAIIGRLLPARARRPALELAGRFLTGLESLRSFRNVLAIFATSVLIWLLETVKYWFVMQAFDFSLSFFALMLMNGVVNLATTLPSAPGYIGTFDAPGIAVLTLYGVEPELATAYTLVLHAALWLPITLLGVVYLLQARMGWADFRRATEAGREGAAS